MLSLVLRQGLSKLGVGNKTNFLSYTAVFMKKVSWPPAILSDWPTIVNLHLGDSAQCWYVISARNQKRSFPRFTVLLIKKIVVAEGNI